MTRSSNGSRTCHWPAVVGRSFLPSNEEPYLPRRAKRDSEVRDSVSARGIVSLPTDRVPQGDRRDGTLRVGSYVVRPDAHGWIVARIKTFLTGSRQGEEYEADLVYPGRFDRALKTLLDLLVRDGIEPDTSLSVAKARVSGAIKPST